MWLVYLLALGCGQDRPPADTPSGGDDTADSGDSGLGPPAAVVDVLVIGGGPAGLCAAWEAQAAGAEVLVLEMEEQAGGSGLWAQNFFAVGTVYQAERGIADDPTLALSQWADLTGGDPDDPWVQRFVGESAETVDWLVSLGAQVTAVAPDLAMGPVPRSHRLEFDGGGPVGPLVLGLAEQTWLNTRAEGLVEVGGRVQGARYTDTQTGLTGWVQAGAVVVATGGFARDPERVVADRPELAGVGLAFEAGPHALGLGLDLLEAVGAASTAPGRSGVYVHAVADPREGFEGEVLWLEGLFYSLVFDLNGTRVTDENQIRGFTLIDTLLAAPEQRLFALIPSGVYSARPLLVPPYNAGDTELDPEVLVEAGVAGRFATVAEAAAWAGADAPALEATVARYDTLVAAGEDSDQGKDPLYLVPFGNEQVVVLELTPGSAKSFVGAALDAEGRVLDGEGQPIPGLYAAGEVAGFLGTEAVGVGFSGAINAAYWSGRVVGPNAAAQAR